MNRFFLNNRSKSSITCLLRCGQAPNGPAATSLILMEKAFSNMKGFFRFGLVMPSLQTTALQGYCLPSHTREPPQRSSSSLGHHLQRHVPKPDQSARQ